MPYKILNIIEPTLFDQTGHGFSYVQSLLLANNEFAINVWLDRRGQKIFPASLCTTQGYFIRALRQVQKVFLYFWLCCKSEIILVSTSDLWDLKLFASLSRLLHSKAKIFLHFHQFKQTTKKLNSLRKIAAANPRLTILTPTLKLAQIFTTAGFKQCIVVPCPTFTPPRPVNATPAEFHKVLYAGAARQDKGFPVVVQLLEYLRTNNINTKFEVQVSTPNSQRYDQATTQALEQLKNIPTNNLILHRNTLDQSQYLSLFNNSICLLLYDQNSYQDKFSGIALDAFYAGCPIITVKNTWMGDTAEKYAAGLALDTLDLSRINEAIETIMQNYAFYNNNAIIAAAELRQLHDPKNTLAMLNQ